jgi:NADH-quinone oxidoreductase subunit L
MLQLLWLVPAFPFASFLGLVLIGSRLSRPEVALIGVGSVGISALVSIVVALSFINAPPPGYAYTQTLWQWMPYRW